MTQRLAQTVSPVAPENTRASLYRYMLPPCAPPPSPSDTIDRIFQGLAHSGLYRGALLPVLATDMPLREALAKMGSLAAGILPSSTRKITQCKVRGHGGREGGTGGRFGGWRSLRGGQALVRDLGAEVWAGEGYIL